jgi:DNA-binding MarR family transcriptional regulator
MPRDLDVLARLVRDPVTGRLTPRQLLALDYVVAHPGVATPGTVATSLKVTIGPASRIVDRLVEEKLVRRTHDEDDRRVILLTPTKAGVALIERAIGLLAA